MRLKIVETNFSNLLNWTFRLINEVGEEYFIMDSRYYEHNSFEYPISKKELDGLDNGQWINATVELIDGINVVTKLY